MLCIVISIQVGGMLNLVMRKKIGPTRQMALFLSFALLLPMTNDSSRGLYTKYFFPNNHYHNSIVMGDARDRS